MRWPCAHPSAASIVRAGALFGWATLGLAHLSARREYVLRHRDAVVCDFFNDPDRAVFHARRACAYFEQHSFLLGLSPALRRLHENDLEIVSCV